MEGSHTTSLLFQSSKISTTQVMPKTCILTDSTAYFTKPAFAGQDELTILPHFIQVDDHLQPDSRDLSIYTDPPQFKKLPRTLPPSVEAFQSAYKSLGMQYREIIVILLSSHLSQAYANALQAVTLAKSPAEIFIIDSLNTAIGLGLLVQAAAEFSHRGYKGVEITRLVRGMINHIYSVFCLPDLSFLSHSGQLDPTQAIVGEMLGVIPFFTLENGRLVHTQKIRSSRHLVDIMYEFVAEFENLKYLALLQGVSSYEQESRNLRDRISQNVRTTPLCEHALSLALATVIGPHSIGLVAMENQPKDG
jgi:DegV family protein with EDD domain